MFLMTDVTQFHNIWKNLAIAARFKSQYMAFDEPLCDFSPFHTQAVIMFIKLRHARLFVV